MENENLLTVTTLTEQCKMVHFIEDSENESDSDDKEYLRESLERHQYVICALFLTEASAAGRGVNASS